MQSTHLTRPINIIYDQLQDNHCTQPQSLKYLFRKHRCKSMNDLYIELNSVLIHRSKQINKLN
jgi:hypothetical protein